MEILIHGTKGGCKTLYPVSEVPEVMYRFASDARRTDSKGNTHWQVYSLSFSGRGCIFSKYVGVRDVLRQYGGFVAFSVHIPYSQRMDGYEVQQLLDELAGRYCHDYVQDGNLNGEVHEDWLFVNATAHMYENKLRQVQYREASSFLSGGGEPAFVYYENETNLRKLLDTPFQDEYIPYKQVFFIDQYFKGSEESPLNALRHDPQADLTSVIDLENTKYRLRLPQKQYSNNEADVEVKVNGSPRRNDDKIYRKNTISITYSKRYYEPIQWEGRISDSEASQYLVVSDGTVTVLPMTLDKMRQATRRIDILVTEKNGKPVSDYSVKASSRLHAEKQLGQATYAEFTGEELGDHWTLSVVTGDGRKDSRSFVPEDQSSAILLQPQKSLRAVFTVIDDNGVLNDCRISVMHNGVSTDAINGEYDFKGDEIESLVEVRVSKDGYETTFYRFCPGEDTKPKVKLKKAAESKKRYFLEVDTNKGSSDTLIIYKTGDIYNVTPEAKKGYRFVEWEDHSRTKKNFHGENYDGYYTAIFKQVWWARCKWLLIAAAMVALAVLAILLIRSCISTPTGKYNYKVNDSIKACKGDVKNLAALKERWMNYKPEVETSGGFLGFGGHPDSTNLVQWRSDTAAIGCLLAPAAPSEEVTSNDDGGEIVTPDNTPATNAQEIKRQEIRTAFWTLYNTDRNNQDKWVNLYKTYQDYNRNPYVQFMYTITTGKPGAFSKFLSLKVVTQYNDSGLQQLVDAYNGKTTNTPTTTTSIPASNSNDIEEIEEEAEKEFLKLIKGNPNILLLKNFPNKDGGKYKDTECGKYIKSMNDDELNLFKKFLNPKDTHTPIDRLQSLGDVKNKFNDYKKALND